MLKSTYLLLMVPPRRIELRIDPYHGSVIPLNYGGNAISIYLIGLFYNNIYSTNSANKS